MVSGFRRIGLTLGFSALVAGAGAGSASLARAQEPASDVLVALDRMALKGGRPVTAPLEGGGEAELTLSPELQEAVEAALAAQRVPLAAAAVVSIRDGRILALAGRSESDPTLGPEELALRPWAPSASVFKLVSASALVDRGVGPNVRVCFHGGLSAVGSDNLIDLPHLDRRCETLGYAIGKSQNAIIAKLTNRFLQPQHLRDMAERFGFGVALPFDAPWEPSTVDIPDDSLERARASAGFYHSSLSVLHGALLAATFANGGVMPAPRLIERAVGPTGLPLDLRVRAGRRVLDPEVARKVGRMMELTARMGTAKAAFCDKRGRSLLPVSVAGKTGTLNFRADDETSGPAPALALSATAEGLGASWFVGYAPADRPRVAFAVLLAKPPGAHVRASFVAREVLAQHLALQRGTSHPPRLLAAR